MNIITVNIFEVTTSTHYVVNPFRFDAQMKINKDDFINNAEKILILRVRIIII